MGTYLFNMQDMCQLSCSNSDFAIICEGVTIPCHQIFLSNSSKVFAEKIEADHMENNGTDEKVVKKGVLDVPCSAFVGKTCYDLSTPENWIVRLQKMMQKSF